MGIFFRGFKSSDAGALVRIFNRCFEGHRTLEEWNWMYLQMPGFSTSGIIVAEDEESGQVVASLVVSEAEVMINGKRRVIGFIDDVETLPEWRRRGIANRLMWKAIEYCRKSGHSAIFLYTNPYGEGARIYRRMGFKDAQDFYIHAKTTGVRNSLRQLPFPMSLLGPLMAVPSKMNSRRCRGLRSLVSTYQLDPGNEVKFEAYLDALNHSLGNKPLFYPYSREQLEWLIKKAPKSVSPVARFAQKSGEIACGGIGSIFRMKFFGKIFNTWVISDIFVSADLQDPLGEAYIRTVVEGLVRDGESRDCALHMVLASEYDTKIRRSLQSCGYFRFVPTTFMCYSLEKRFSLPKKGTPWYVWKQHMIGVP